MIVLFLKEESKVQFLQILRQPLTNTGDGINVILQTFITSYIMSLLFPISL